MSVGTDDVIRSLREIPPMHYTLEIDSLSELQQILSNTKAKSFESQIFEAGGHKWKLSLYPDGDDDSNGEGYVSMYLIIAETEALPLGWEVNVEFKFLVFDQIRGNFLTIQDANGRVRRFHRMKTAWGFAKLLPLGTFRDASKGYLVSDKCAFGTDIFVVSRSGKGERLTLGEKPDKVAYTWKIDQFSGLGDCHCSPIFTLANFKWKLSLYPKGDSRAEGKYLSLFLGIEADPASRVYAEYTLTIRDQLNNKDKSINGHNWFGTQAWGSMKFISLTDIEDGWKGFLVKDTMIVEARIESISTVQSFSEEY